MPGGDSAARGCSARAWLAPYRRTLGLLAFTYATLHLLTYAVLDLWGAWDTLVEDVAEAARTSRSASRASCVWCRWRSRRRARWIRRLGKRWVQLHRLVYVAAVAGCLHFLWLVKKDVREPLIYSAMLAALFAARVAAAAAPELGARPTKARKSASLSASSWLSGCHCTPTQNGVARALDRFDHAVVARAPRRAARGPGVRHRLVMAARDTELLAAAESAASREPRSSAHAVAAVAEPVLAPAPARSVARS